MFTFLRIVLVVTIFAVSAVLVDSLLGTTGSSKSVEEREFFMVNSMVMFLMLCLVLGLYKFGIIL